MASDQPQVVDVTIDGTPVGCYVLDGGDHARLFAATRLRELADTIEHGRPPVSAAPRPQGHKAVSP